MNYRGENLGKVWAKNIFIFILTLSLIARILIISISGFLQTIPFPFQKGAG